MPKKPKHWEEFLLFDLPSVPRRIVQRLKRPPEERLWTGNKALLISRYLWYFVLITRHGTYLDGFAGPQDPAQPQSWSAKLVLESKPERLRHFHLFEQNPAMVRLLEELRAEHPGRGVEVYPGDVNRRITDVLRPDVIPPREATFCLLDQRMFECDWTTLEKLAGYMPPERELKIELFYFLAAAWFDRSLAAVTTPEGFARVRAWWGRDDWPTLRGLGDFRRAQLVKERFMHELRYLSAEPYAIYSRRGGGRVMYYMIHATDHPDAPKLMDRAYRGAVTPEKLDQLTVDDLLHG